jgi:hypothetical protein
VSGRWFIAGFVAFLAVTFSVLVALPGWLDDEPDHDSSCLEGHYRRATYVTMTRELMALARALTIDADSEVQAIVEAVDRFDEDWGTFRDVEDGECSDFDVAEDYVLTIQYLVAHPDAASPELLAGLQEAAYPDENYPIGGIDGIYNFLHDPTMSERDYEGIEQLRSRLRDQTATINETRDDLTTRPRTGR